MGPTMKRVRDIAIETLIAIVLVSAFVAYLFTRPKESNLDWQRIAQVVNTMIVFGFLISWFRQAWRKFLFWTLITMLLLGHLAAYGFLLGRVPHVPFGYYALLNVIELGLFSQILSKVLWKHTGQNSTKITQ